ncbi:hypothetical protein ABZ905_28090 [Streptomyces parvus]|uniref:hypothetical protein n=1 Tax=Streptomyces parvus TaxID=66428 RepID=UPI0033D7BEDA
MADNDIPDHLIDLESAAWAEQQPRALTFAAADAVQAAYREHAASTGVSSLETGDGRQAGRAASGERARSMRKCPTGTAVGARVSSNLPAPQQASGQTTGA